MKAPVTVDELQELIKLLAKYLATHKGQNLQKTDPTAHALLVKWNRFQLHYKKRIEHFLPRIGDHPEVTLHGVVTEWDPSPRAKNEGEDVNIPVDFPPATVIKYKSANDAYIPSAPIKETEAKLVMSIVPLDVRFLLGCGLKWDIRSAPDDDIPRAPASNAPPAEGADRADRSRSPSPPYDPLRFTDWDVLTPLNIPFEEMQFEPTLEFTSNRAYHAAAILFFLHPDLPVKFPAVKDAIHAGWMTTFKHPMNYDELRRPPCVGASAYSEEEQSWCTATIQHLVDSLDTAGRQSRGIPETAATRRISGRAPAPRPPPRPPQRPPQVSAASGMRTVETSRTSRRTMSPGSAPNPSVRRRQPQKPGTLFLVFFESWVNTK